MYHRARGPSPLWERRNVASEGGVVDLVNEGSEEGGGVDVRVGLQLRIDLDDESGSNGGK